MSLMGHSCRILTIVAPDRRAHCHCSIGARVAVSPVDLDSLGRTWRLVAPGVGSDGVPGRVVWCVGGEKSVNLWAVTGTKPVSQWPGCILDLIWSASLPTCRPRSRCPRLYFRRRAVWPVAIVNAPPSRANSAHRAPFIWLQGNAQSC